MADGLSCLEDTTVLYRIPHHPWFQRQGKLRAISAVDSLSHRVCGCS